MKYRKLRIAWSVVWGVVAVLVVVVWVRSYWITETASWTFARTLVEFTSFRGQLGNLILDYGTDMPTETKFDSWPIGPNSQVEYNDGTGRPLPSYLGFKSSWLSAPALRGGDTSEFVMPYWSPAVLGVCLAACPWVRSPWRFSLRTLLIATTLVAVVLGLIVWLR
jgi:hypothetical protein